MTFEVFFNTFLPYLIEVLIRDMKKHAPLALTYGTLLSSQGTAAHYQAIARFSQGGSPNLVRLKAGVKSHN